MQLFFQALQFRNVFGDQVLMLHRQYGQLEANKTSDFACPQTAGIHDVLGVYRTRCCNDVPAAVRPLAGIDDTGLSHNLGAANLRRLGVGMRDTVWVHMPFNRIVDGAQKMFLVEQRINLLGFCNGNQFQLHAQITTARLRHFEPVNPLRCSGKHQPAGHMHAAGLPRNLFDLFVEIDRVLLQFGDVGVAVDGMHTACGMPSRTRREFRAFNEQHVLPAGFC